MVAQDYLKVIWTAQEWSHEKVSTKLLAERIGVSASTASESIRKLADQGLVDHEKYGAVDWWYGVLLRRNPVPVRLDPVAE